jgi:DNA-binding MarR family transcriptional regulator
MICHLPSCGCWASSTISELIDRATARGLVTRIAHPRDGRSVRVALTESARELVPEITGIIGKRIEPLIGGLTALSSSDSQPCSPKRSTPEPLVPRLF